MQASTIQQFGRRRLMLATAIALSLSSFAAQAAPASPAVAERLRSAIESQTGGKVPVTSINDTPIKGIYEVVSEKEVFYVDESGRYGFVDGRLVDLRTQRDLTAARLDQITAIPFNSLPLQHAIKEVRGNGQRRMAVFEDPNCPICRVFNKFVAQLDDVTVYRFMFPVIDPSSGALARVAWCSRDRAASWDAIMNGARPQGNENCDVQGLVSILKFGEKHQMNNTPTVILPNGKRLVGATPPEQFIAELDAANKK